MNKILTIIVPTYNMQDYLPRCLDSLILSAESFDALEVLVINDGSKDRSSEIAHSYEDRYPETFRVIDKENGNYGSCINRGLAEAKGKYIKILDADDWFDNDTFCEYLSLLECQEQVDIVLTDFTTVNTEGTILSRRSFNLYPGVSFDFQKYEEHRAIFDMHSVTYRAQLLKDIGYVQTEGISHTDVEWVFLPMYSVKKSIYYPLSLYQYLVGREGQTMDPKVITKTIGNHIAVARRIMSFYNGLDNVPLNTKARVDSEINYLSRVIYKSCLVEQNSNMFDSHQLAEYDKELLEYSPDVFSDVEKHMRLNGLPFHYVRFWHRFGLRFPLSGIRDIVRKVRYS